VTTTAAQRITGGGSMAIALPTGGPINADIDLCYRQSATSNALINMTSFSYTTVQVSTLRINYPVNGSVVPGAGTWQVGPCVRNGSASAISANDYANGYVIVTN